MYQPNNPEHSYNGNTQVKCDGVTYNYTEWETTEYLKCMTDVEYFARNYIKVINLDKGLCAFEPYGYQKDMLKHYSENRFSIVLSCRQSGKCQSINTLVTVRNKKTGLVEKITVGELHERIKRNSKESN